MKDARTPLALLALLPAALLAAGCRSTGGDDGGSSVDSLVDLYDVADPLGVIELEYDRDGSVVEMEAEIPIADLPQAVREAALAKAPGGLITGAEREVHDGDRYWEVKIWHDERDWEFVVDSKGHIHETEQTLHAFEWPAEIVAAADEALPGGYVTSVEIIEHEGEGTAYHVKKEIQGASYKLALGEDGAVTRVVREQRAEIEIPLKAR